MVSVSERWWAFYQNLSHLTPVWLQLWSPSGQSHNKHDAHSILSLALSFTPLKIGLSLFSLQSSQVIFVVFFPLGFIAVILFGVHFYIAEAELLLYLKKKKKGPRMRSL